MARLVLVLCSLSLFALAAGCKGQAAPTAAASATTLSPGLTTADVRSAVKPQNWEIETCIPRPTGPHPSACELKRGPLLAYVYLAGANRSVQVGPAGADKGTKGSSKIGVIVQDSATAKLLRDRVFPTTLKNLDGITTDQLTQPLVADGWTVTSHTARDVKEGHELEVVLQKGNLEAQVGTLDGSVHGPLPPLVKKHGQVDALATATVGGDEGSVLVLDKAEEQKLLAAFHPDATTPAPAAPAPAAPSSGS